MLHLTTRFWAVLLVGGLTLFSASAFCQETKSRFKVVTFAELTKTPDKSDTATILMESLNRLGKSGWEAMAEGDKGIVFRESARGQTWEYRMVRAPESSLNGKSDDDEVLQLVLDGLSTQGWELCLGRAIDGKHLVFKRGQQRYHDKDTKKASIDVPPATLPLPPALTPDFPPRPPIDAKK